MEVLLLLSHGQPKLRGARPDLHQHPGCPSEGQLRAMCLTCAGTLLSGGSL